jgi:hypothetical protein
LPGGFRGSVCTALSGAFFNESFFFSAESISRCTFRCFAMTLAVSLADMNTIRAHFVRAACPLLYTKRPADYRTMNAMNLYPAVGDVADLAARDTDRTRAMSEDGFRAFYEPTRPLSALIAVRVAA